MDLFAVPYLLLAILGSSAGIPRVAAQQEQMETWKSALESGNNEIALAAVEILRLALDQLYDEPAYASTEGDQATVCSNCQKFLPYLAAKVEANPNIYERVVEFAKWACIAKQLQPTQRACIGTVESLKQIFHEVILPVSKTSPQTMCSSLVGLDCGKSDDPTNNWWEVTIPPALSKKAPSAAKKSSGRTFTLLHISDAHIDLQYAVDSPAVCTEWMCCRYDSPPTDPTSSGKAGEFGEYNCDIPASALKLLLEHIVQNHQVDAVYFTGDFTPHDDWYQTKDGYLATIGTVNRLFKKALGPIPAYMVIGNHDTVPKNKFPNPATSSYMNMSWLYGFLADEWVDSYRWLSPEANTVLRRAGIYNEVVRPGLRVIGINNMGCERRNWWLFVNSTDPEGVLQQLVDWLAAAEANSEKVHLIMHIDAGATGRCLRVWSWNYFTIVNRFRDTIAAQFSGHSHENYFTIYYDDVEFTTPVSILHVGPSLVSFRKHNPGYRVVTVDADTFQLIDYDIYFVDLQQSNRKKELVVNRLFSAKETFGLADMSPQSWHDLAGRFQHDDSIFQRYYKTSYRLARNETCGGACKRKQLCKIHTSRAEDDEMCDRFVPLSNGSSLEGTVFSYALIVLLLILNDFFLLDV